MHVNATGSITCNTENDARFGFRAIRFWHFVSKELLVPHSQAKTRDLVDRPIASVRVLQCGKAEQHWEHRYGSKRPQLWWVFLGKRWVPLPLQSFMIAHRDGLVLFDTGIDPAVQFDKSYIRQAIGRFLLARIFRLHLKETDRIDHVLSDVGVSPKDISKAVISHLHFDHVGGISQIPQAELLVSAREWAILSEPHPEKEWMLREHIEIPGADWRQISFVPTDDPLFADFGGVHDVTGDGSMILLPTPGHTPGSLSMLIRQDGWNPILLVADLTYEVAMLEADRVPGTGDPDVLRASFAKVRRLRERLPGLEIVASHDFGAKEAIARATGPTDLMEDSM